MDLCVTALLPFVELQFFIRLASGIHTLNIDAHCFAILGNFEMDYQNLPFILKVGSIKIAGLNYRGYKICTLGDRDLILEGLFGGH